MGNKINKEWTDFYKLSAPPGSHQDKILQTAIDKVYELKIPVVFDFNDMEIIVQLRK